MISYSNIDDLKNLFSFAAGKKACRVKSHINTMMNMFVDIKWLVYGDAREIALFYNSLVHVWKIL